MPKKRYNKDGSINLNSGRIYVPFRLGKNGKVTGGFVKNRK